MHTSFDFEQTADDDDDDADDDADNDDDDVGVSSRSPSESSPAVSPHLSSSPRSRAARSSSSQLLDVGWTSDRHASGSRSLGTSPRPSTSLDPADPVLALPRAGQHGSNQELDQALEMSQLNLRGKQSHITKLLLIL